MLTFLLLKVNTHTIPALPFRVRNSSVAINYVCTGNLGFPIYSAILWSWKACLNLFGAVIAAKTWHCEDGVGEVRHSLCATFTFTRNMTKAQAAAAAYILTASVG